MAEEVVEDQAQEWAKAGLGEVVTLLSHPEYNDSTYQKYVESPDGPAKAQPAGAWIIGQLVPALTPLISSLGWPPISRNMPTLTLRLINII